MYILKYLDTHFLTIHQYQQSGNFRTVQLITVTNDQSPPHRLYRHHHPTPPHYILNRTRFITPTLIKYIFQYITRLLIYTYYFLYFAINLSVIYIILYLHYVHFISTSKSYSNSNSNSNSNLTLPTFYQTTLSELFTIMKHPVVNPTRIHICISKYYKHSLLPEILL